MSGILAVIGAAGTLPGDDLVATMLGTMRGRGGDLSGTWRDEQALLAVARHEWELGHSFAGGVAVAHEHGVAVVADGTLYYRDELFARLRVAGCEPSRTTPTHLVLAAYRAWGERCGEHLEGDIAFVVWDARRRRVLASRDFGGKRPLYYAQVEDMLIVASSISAVLAHPACPSTLNLTAIAEDAAGLSSGTGETSYLATRALLGGHRLLWSAGSAPEIEREWNPPAPNDSDTRDFASGAEELARLLRRATAERLPRDEGSAVWLSGGWDSTAIYGFAQQVRAQRGDTSPFAAVSMSYPAGDPGREDELINDVTAYWNTAPHWVDIRETPMFHESVAAPERAEPFTHPFEMWNRTLARGARNAQAHVALDGVGGDQLFQVSDVYLADVLRSGRLHTVAREWRARGLSLRQVGPFWEWVVRPALGSRVCAAIDRLRGRRFTHYLERRVPAWIRGDFAQQHDLLGRERSTTPIDTGLTCASHETQWYLLHPYFPRVFGCVAEIALSEGVEMRSPLYDRRVVEFALSRPRSERALGGETKRLLRHAARGLLPAHVLAPRRNRTGVTSGYFSRSMREHLPLLVAEATRDSLLADLGIIEPAQLRQAADRYLAGTDQSIGGPLFFTIQTERWLRARRQSADVSRVQGAPTAAVAAGLS